MNISVPQSLFFYAVEPENSANGFLLREIATVHPHFPLQDQSESREAPLSGKSKRPGDVEVRTRATRPQLGHVVQGMTKPFDKQKEEDSIANRIKASGNRHHGVCTLSYLYQVLKNHRGMSMERNNKMFVRRLKRDGFQLGSVPGSHDKFRKTQITEIVPNPKKDLPIGTARAIARQVGWLKEEDR